MGSQLRHKNGVLNMLVVMSAKENSQEGLNLYRPVLPTTRDGNLSLVKKLSELAYQMSTTGNDSETHLCGLRTS